MRLNEVPGIVTPNDEPGQAGAISKRHMRPSSETTSRGGNSMINIWQQIRRHSVALISLAVVVLAALQ
jgi:hypothetical protein